MEGKWDIFLNEGIFILLGKEEAFSYSANHIYSF